MDGSPDADGQLGDETLVPGELAWAIQHHNMKLDQHLTKVNEQDDVPSAYGFFILGPGAEAWAIQHKIAPADSRKVHPSWGYGGLEISNTDGYLWVLGSVTPDDHKWLHADPKRCLGCGTGVPVNLAARVQMYGMFEFDCMDYGHPPYNKTHEPGGDEAQTLEEIQRQINGTIKTPPRFAGFCFYDKESIQPMEHLPSSTYGDDGWVREDGVRVSQDGTPKKDQDD